MNENYLNQAKEQIKKENTKIEKIEQLRTELPGEISEYKNLVEGMKKPGIPQEEVEALAEFKESFENSFNRKIPEIVSLLENEKSMMEGDLTSTEAQISKTTDEELISTFKEQVDYLKEGIKKINEEMEEYQSVLKAIA